MVVIEFTPNEKYGYQYPTLRCPVCGTTREMDTNDVDAGFGLSGWLEEHKHEEAKEGKENSRYA